MSCVIGCYCMKTFSCKKNVKFAGYTYVHALYVSIRPIDITYIYYFYDTTPPHGVYPFVQMFRPRLLQLMSRNQRLKQGCPCIFMFIKLKFRDIASNLIQPDTDSNTGHLTFSVATLVAAFSRMDKELILCHENT